jgi:hypothetical protein
MLRRAGSLLRILLAAAGLALLLWMPLSARIALELSRTHPSANQWYTLWIGGGQIIASDASMGLPPSLPGAWRMRLLTGREAAGGVPLWEPAWRRWLLPGTSSVSFFLPGGFSQPYTWRALAVPLWLPALLCLAWPLTSLLLARRRRGRGFEVGMTNDANQHDEAMATDE